MAQHSSIEWTDSTWNPVTGCTKVSPGCKNCYAQTFAERWRGIKGHPYEQGFDLRLWSSRLDLPLLWKKPRRIFVNSMSDLFHPGVPNRFIEEVFEIMRRAEWHQFQVLTKRPERLVDFLRAYVKSGNKGFSGCSHIWLGTSVESQDYIGRAKDVATLPSAVRFLSCEPLLGPLDLSEVLGGAGINWVIVGGESGPGARPVKELWVEEIRDQCQERGVPFFFKQWGGVRKKKSGRLLKGRSWDELPNHPEVRSISHLSA